MSKLLFRRKDGGKILHRLRGHTSTIQMPVEDPAAATFELVNSETIDDLRVYLSECNKVI